MNCYICGHDRFRILLEHHDEAVGMSELLDENGEPLPEFTEFSSPSDVHIHCEQCGTMIYCGSRTTERWMLGNVCLLWNAEKQKLTHAPTALSRSTPRHRRPRAKPVDLSKVDKATLLAALEKMLK